jgi:hypothetical protein
MIINLKYKGINEINDFKNSRLDIKLPLNLNSPYKYINKIEYKIINEIQYTVVFNNDILFNSIESELSKISGTTLDMYDLINNNTQIHINEENIISFIPYNIYKGCLDTFLSDFMLNTYNTYFRDNLELHFMIDIKLSPKFILKRNNNSEYIPVYDGINCYDTCDNLCDYCKYDNTTVIIVDPIIKLIPNTFEWQMINQSNEDENPIKRSKR